MRDTQFALLYLSASAATASSSSAVMSPGGMPTRLSETETAA